MKQTRIDGVYFSPEYTEGWVIQKDGELFLAPQQAIFSKDLQKTTSLNKDLMRPVGEATSKLLLRNSDLVKNTEIE